jgi:hypothetical protein
MARTPLRSITSRAFAGVVAKSTCSPLATPFSSRRVNVRWVCTSMAGKRGFSTRVSGTWSMLSGRKS